MRKKAVWIIPSILVMALLALLVVLPASAAPSGADGTIILNNGPGDLGLFYSDKTTCGDAVNTCNIAKASIADVDFSTTRTGVARTEVNSTTTAMGVAPDGFPLTSEGAESAGKPIIVLAGEKADSEKFSGDGATTVFGLTKKGRDANDDGALTAADVTATVSGVAATVTAVTVSTNGQFIDSVTIGTAGTGTVPTLGTDNVEISFEISDYDIDTPGDTPFAASGSSVKFGATFAAATNVSTISVLDSGLGEVSVITDIPENNKVVITFVYNVADTEVDLVTFTTPSLGARGLTRTIDGVETGANTAVFEASVGIFSGADFDTIVTVANKALVTSIDEIISDISADLGGRIATMAPLLGFRDQAAGGSAAAFVALLVPGANGEVLSASYLDNPTRTDTASIDLKAPTVTLVSPADGGSTKSLASLKVRVTDELSPGGTASGISIANADEIVIDGGTPDIGPAIVSAANTSSILVASNSFEITASVTSVVLTSEGKITWWTITQDDAGNIPNFVDNRTKAQVAQGVANPAVQGAGDPGTPTASPGNAFSVTVDTAAPTPLTTNAVKTGGAIDTRLTVLPTGSHTVVASSTTVLTDEAADFVGAGVVTGDTVTNLTDGSFCTVTGVTTTTLTCAAGLVVGVAGVDVPVPDRDWDMGDNYKVENPELGNIKEDNTVLDAVIVEFDLSTGGAPLDSGTVSASDFNLKDSGGSLLTIDSATVDAKGNKVLLGLAANLGTADTPTLEIVPDTGDEILDLANNAVAIVTGTSAITSVDKLAPIIGGPGGATAPVITGTAASRPASNGSVTIEFNAGEGAATTPTVTAAYLVADGAAPYTLTQDSLKDLSVTSSGVNTWQATLTITTISGASRPGLVNVRITLTDAAGNVASAGLVDPDGTVTADAGTILADALVFEFDNKLNDGFSVRNVFVISPNTSTTEDPKSDVDNPFITINFDNEGTEDRIVNTGGFAAGGVDTIYVDTHDDMTLTSAIWGFPDGTTEDVLASVVRADDNSYVFAPVGLPVGTHTFEVQATDEVGNVSTSVGSLTPTTFKLTMEVTARAAYKNPLKPGFNLISFPAPPDSSVAAINDAIPATSPIDFVMTYDNPTGLFLVATRDTDPESATFGELIGNLTTIDASHAYWVQTDRFFDFELLLPRSTAGTAVFPPIINVFLGWNLVPIGDRLQRAAGSMTDPDLYFAGVKWSAAVSFDPARNQFIRTSPDASSCGVVPNVPLPIPPHPCLENALGYFVYVTEDGVIIP